MRRSGLCLAVLGLAASPALAKFGISKTRVTLPRIRPAAIEVVVPKLFLDVRSDAPEVRGVYVDTVRDHLAQALEASDLYRLMDDRKQAQATIEVSLSSLYAEVRDEVRSEVRYVKVGEREEWDSKKNKYVYKDVYGNRTFLVTWRVADGRLSGRLRVRSGQDQQSSDVSTSYSHEYNSESSVPPEAQTEEGLREFLVDQAAAEAVAAVTPTPDPVDVLLAVNGELKDGNKLAEAGRFEEALARWSAKTYKGNTEAARRHNVGVAHEALAYAVPPDSERHLRNLEEAQAFYSQARELDPDEKYFKEPLERIQVSLDYAKQARRFSENLEASRGTRPGASARHERPRPATAPAEPASTGSAPSAPEGTPLRNGSFESGYDYWSLSGTGNVVDDPDRGRVFEASAKSSRTSLSQALDLAAARGARLSLDYRVLGGHPDVRLVVEYVDAGGQERRSVLDVARHAAAAAWSPWSSELSGLRPPPGRIKGVQLLAESGAVRIDNVALTLH